MRRATFALLVLCGCLWASEAKAQVTLGLKGSLNIANVDANDEAGSDIDLNTRTAVGGGLYLQAGLGDVFALQVEGLYTPRGARGDDGNSTLSLSYIDVPLLFLVRVPAGDASIWPILYAGPVFSFETSCKLKDDAGDSIDCGTGSGDAFNTQSIDYAGTVGGGFEVFMGRYTLQLDVRYTHGVSNIDDTPGGEAASVKNRTWSFFLGFGRVLVP